MAVLLYGCIVLLLYSFIVILFYGWLSVPNMVTRSSVKKMMITYVCVLRNCQIYLADSKYAKFCSKKQVKQVESAK